MVPYGLPLICWTVTQLLLSFCSKIKKTLPVDCSSPLLGEPCLVPSSPISVIPHLCISI